MNSGQGDRDDAKQLTRSQALNEALKQPNGARFYRCALQVNPFAYHGRHAKQSTYQNEADYNAAIIEATSQQHRSLPSPIIIGSAIRSV